MSDENKRTIGSTALKVPALCFGTSGLGDMPGTYGYSVDEQRAVDTCQAIIDSDYAFFDSSRNYGMGRSEERLGKAFRAYGKLPDNVVVSTKLDRDMDSGRFDAARARQSVEQSLAALGLDKVQLLHLHDPEHCSDQLEITRSGGALDELFKMKEEGLADAVGLAAGRIDIMMPMLQDWPFDALITHNRHTLVSANAEPMITLAQQRGISVLNAAPYHGGVLAKGSANYQRFVYQEANSAMLAPLQAVEAICARFEIPPGAAALQFSTRDERVASTICGVSKPERVAQTIAWAEWDSPAEAWQAIAQLQRSTDDPEATRVYDPS